MIRHIVMINFKPEISKQQQDAFIKKSVEKLAQIPGTRNVCMGQALEVTGKARYGSAMFADFDDEISLKSYLGNPIHKTATTEMIPMLIDFLIADYQY